MPREETIRVSGYRELLRSTVKADKETKRLVRDVPRKAGDVVRADAERRFDPYSAESAHGYKVRVRQTGVVVEQSLRKTTGQNPGWGKKQMRVALIPALRHNEKEVVRQFEQGFEHLAARF